VPLLGGVLVDPELARKCDQGQIESYPGQVFEPVAAAVSLLVPEVRCYARGVGQTMGRRVV
jgi:hypothetical protein